MNRARILFAGVAVVIAATIALIVATSGGSATRARSSGSPNSAISLRQTPVGKALVDASGRTLYLFEADKPNLSTLSAAGQAVWPPFTASTRPRALNGAVAADIGTINGAGGSRQVTYSGHPLYYFAGDRNPGQTLGQGLNEFGALWYVLAGNGSAVTSAPQSSSAPSGNGSTYGY